MLTRPGPDLQQPHSPAVELGQVALERGQDRTLVPLGSRGKDTEQTGAARTWRGAGAGAPAIGPSLWDQPPCAPASLRGLTGVRLAWKRARRTAALPSQRERRLWLGAQSPWLRSAGLCDWRQTWQRRWPLSATATVGYPCCHAQKSMRPGQARREMAREAAAPRADSGANIWPEAGRARTPHRRHSPRRS